VKKRFTFSKAVVIPYQKLPGVGPASVCANAGAGTTKASEINSIDNIVSFFISLFYKIIYILSVQLGELL